MKNRRWLSFTLAGLFVLSALTLFVSACLPYDALKTLSDALTSDGNFNTLKGENVDVFRALLAAAGLTLLVAAALTAFRRWSLLAPAFRRFLPDLKILFRSCLPSRKEGAFLVAALLVTVIAGILRLENICSSLHHDEAYTFVAFARSLFTAVSDYHLPNNHVFHTVLVYLSTQAFGIQPWAVRLPAYVAGVLLSPVVYALGKRHYDRWTGLAAALLIAFSPVLISYSHNARGYTLVALFTLLLLLLADFVRRQVNLPAWGLISLLSALGMFTVPVMLFPIGIVFLWLFLENLYSTPEPYRSRRRFLRYWAASGFGAALLTILLYLPILVYSGPADLFANSFVTPLPWGELLETLRLRFAETWSEWTYRMPLVVIVVLVMGLLLSLGLHKKISTLCIPLQLATFLWIGLLILVQRPNAWSKEWFFSPATDPALGCRGAGRCLAPAAPQSAQPGSPGGPHFPGLGVVARAGHGAAVVCSLAIDWR